MYVEIPAVEGTPESRIAALREARELLKGEPKTTSPAIFGGGSTEPGEVAGSTELLNLATYIETGHSYFDTHPTGKRRPIIKNIHMTMMAPPNLDVDDLAHLIEHVKDGSFAEFVEDMLKNQTQPSEGDAAESADSGDTKPEDDSLDPEDFPNK